MLRTRRAERPPPRNPSARTLRHTVFKSRRTNNFILQDGEDAIYIISPIQQGLPHRTELLFRDADLEKLLPHVTALDPLLVLLSEPLPLRRRRVARRARALNHARRIEPALTVPRIQRDTDTYTAPATVDDRQDRVVVHSQKATRVRVPGEGPAVAFARREQAAGFADAAHFADRGDWVGDVDEDLVREHNVKGGVWEGQAGEQIACLEGEVARRVGGAGSE